MNVVLVGYKLHNYCWLISFLQERQAITVSKEGKLPEVKILIIFCYFLGVSVLAIVCYVLSFWTGSVNEGLTRYILCQSNGVQPGAESCDRSQLSAIVRLQATCDAVAFLFVLLPTVNLLYAVNPKRIRQLYVRHSVRRKHNEKDKATTFTLDS